MGLLDILGGLLGGGGTQQPTAAQPGGSSTQAPGGGGLSPLAQSLMAGYFGAIGSPKLAGWGGALSRGGLTALDQYNNAKYSDARDQLAQAQAQKALGGGGGVDDAAANAAAADSIESMAQGLKGPQAVAIHQLAAGVRAGAYDRDKAVAQATGVVKQATSVQGMIDPTSGRPYIRQGTDVNVPGGNWQGSPPDMPAQPQVQQPQPQAPQASGGKYSSPPAATVKQQLIGQFIDEYITRFRAANGRPPSPDELKGAIKQSFPDPTIETDLH